MFCGTMTMCTSRWLCVYPQDNVLYPYNDTVWHNGCVSLEWLCVNMCVLYPQWFCALQNDFVYHHNDSSPSQWPVDPYNDSVCPHNNLCALIITLCVFTMTLYDLQNDTVYPYNDPVYPNNELCTLIMTPCALTLCVTSQCLSVSSYYVWPSQWLCVLLNDWVPSDSVCLYNDTVWHLQWCCVSFTVTVYSPHNDICYHINSMWPSMILCTIKMIHVTFTMTL